MYGFKGLFGSEILSNYSYNILHGQTDGFLPDSAHPAHLNVHPI